MTDPSVTQLSILLLISISIAFIGVSSAYFPNKFKNISSFLCRKYQMTRLRKEAKQMKVVLTKDTYRYFKLYGK
jgi:hypothetical protein